MLFSYGYCRWKNWQWWTNAPRLPAISMATAVCWSNTDGIARCAMSRATPGATGHRHRATTCYVLPQWLPGQQANKQQLTNTPKKVAVLMAMAMRRYVTACIAQWRRSRASLEATGRRHWVSIMSDNINRTWLREYFFDVFIIKTVGIGHGLMLRPLFLIGVWHINQNRRAWLRWVYIVLGGSYWHNSICQSGYPIVFGFVRTVSRSCVLDID